jgi:hypothetical protein
MSDTADGIPDALHQAECAWPGANGTNQSLFRAVKPAFEPDSRRFPGAGQEELNAIGDGGTDEWRAVSAAVLLKPAGQVSSESGVMPDVFVAAAEVQQVDGANDQSPLARYSRFHGVRASSASREVVYPPPRFGR